MLGSTRTPLVPVPTTLAHQEGLHDYPFGERDYQAVDFAASYLGAIAELLDEPSS